MLFSGEGPKGETVLNSFCCENAEPSVAAVAQPVERVLGKDEVMGPIPISS